MGPPFLSERDMFMKTQIRAAALLAAVVAVSAAAPALAQDAVWAGEGSFGAGFTTGNTDTSDLGLGLKLGRKTGDWTLSFQALADYGKTDGVETKNRIFGSAQADRDFSERLYGLGRVSYERDEFSGFESRAFAGVGVGYRVIVSEPTKWAVEVAPGVRYDDIRGTLLAPGDSETGFSVIGASKFAHAFNDNVKLTNDTTVTWADASTQIVNTLAVTAALTGALSARASYDVRHDTDAPVGFEKTDTVTRVSLVYAFGK